MDEEIRIIAKCAECGESIFEDNEDVYINEDGDYFCSLECVFNYCGITKSESCLED